MTVVDEARRTAWKLSRNELLTGLTRLGFLGYGVLHLAVAWLAVQIATGRPAVEGDQTGAFRTVAHQPFGRVSLTLIAVGLAAMSLWQLSLAVAGHRQARGARRTFERFASLFRAAAYGFLAITAAKIISGTDSSSAEQQRALARRLLGSPGGRTWIVVIGCAVVALGLGMVLYGLRRGFARRLRVHRMRPGARRAAYLLGQAGYAARGAAIAVAGLLLAATATSHEVSRAGGLDSALRSLAHERFGGPLLAIIAAGFAAFGVYCVFQARYRKTTT